jgi:hypothetical protein
MQQKTPLLTCSIAAALTLLPAALLLLPDVTAVSETMCLLSRSLVTTVSLASLIRLSGDLSQYVFIVE